MCQLMLSHVSFYLTNVALNWVSWTLPWTLINVPILVLVIKENADYVSFKTCGTLLYSVTLSIESHEVSSMTGIAVTNGTHVENRY